MDFREYFAKDTTMLPTKKGITFSVEMWKKLVSLVPEVDKCIDSMEKGGADPPAPEGDYGNYGNGSA